MAVGAPRPDWAEIEPKIWKESLVYVDSFAGAKTEAGDLIQSNCDIADELGGFIKKSKLPFRILGILCLTIEKEIDMSESCLIMAFRKFRI